MAAERLVDHRRLERLGVIGAQESPARRGRKGDVQELLVALALDELLAAAVGRDRLADSTYLAAGVLFDEVLPGRDDPRRVRTDLRHVGKEHLRGLAVQRIPEELDLAGRDDDEHRLALRDPLANKRRDAVDEALVARVEERLMGEPPCMRTPVSGHTAGDLPRADLFHASRRRRYHFQASEAAMIESGTARHTPHCARVKPVVPINRLSISSSVPSTIATAERAVANRNFRSRSCRG
jgi:hypothetical protein